MINYPENKIDLLVPGYSVPPKIVGLNHVCELFISIDVFVQNTIISVKNAVFSTQSIGCPEKLLNPYTIFVT